MNLLFSFSILNLCGGISKGNWIILSKYSPPLKLLIPNLPVLKALKLYYSWRDFNLIISKIGIIALK